MDSLHGEGSSVCSLFILSRTGTLKSLAYQLDLGSSYMKFFLFFFVFLKCSVVDSTALLQDVFLAEVGFAP